MPRYRVKADRKTVWSKNIDGDVTTKNFPERFRGRPDTGTVELYVDDELIGVQTPLDEAYEREQAVRQVEAQLAALRGVNEAVYGPHQSLTNEEN